MNTANFIRLLVLAAIWGSSFLFMRISAPVLGPALLIEYRVLFARCSWPPSASCCARSWGCANTGSTS